MRAIFAPLWQELRSHARFSSLALALVFTYAFFVGPSAWNQNSRLALTRALVEDQTTVIDAHHHTTGDKSWRSLDGRSVRDPDVDPSLEPGHFYSDKAPGVSMLATIPYALFYGFKRASGGKLPEAVVRPLDPLDSAADRRPSPEEMQPGDVLVYNPSHRVALYLCKLGTSVTLSLLGLAALFLLLRRRLGASPRDAGLATLIYGLATPALPYGTAFYGHQPCADLLLIAFALVLLVAPDPADESRELRLGVMVGLVLGLAVAVEYPAAVPVAMLFIWGAWRRGRRFAIGAVVGGSTWAIILALYHQAAFGHPLSTGYDYVYLPEFAEGMAVRYGLGAPSPSVAFELLFGSYRGLFFASPVLLAATWGVAHGLRSAARRARSRGDDRSGLSWIDYAIVVVIPLYYLALNAGYYMWEGGAAFGPRHMVPALPFLALGLVPALRHARFVTLALAVVAGFHTLVIATAGPEAPTHGNPIWSYAVPELISMDGAGAGAATTLGELLGLPGPFALIPLFALWIWLLPRAGRPPAEIAAHPETK